MTIRNIHHSKKETIAVVGGGMTGIAAAIDLAKSGRFEVTLFEQADHLGGMSDFYTWNDLTWDRFYHVILSTDTVMLDFIKEIGLEDQLFWRETKSGFYGDGKLVSMSSTLDFIRFPFMSYWQKFRLGLGIIYSSRIKDPSKLDKIYVRQWLTSVFGRRVYENIWDPLLRSKLGDAREKTSAAFIWATINRLYGARSAENKQEKMGHVHGGYKTILEAAEKTLESLGVQIILNSPVTSVEPIHTSQGAIAAEGRQDHPNRNSENGLKLISNGSERFFDKILLTVNCPTVLNFLSRRNEEPYWNHLKAVNYLGVICCMLMLNRRLSPYYVINLLDKELPFTGIIEATNIVSPDELDGRHLVYLPKYVTADDPVNALNDQEIAELFIAKLKKVYPDLSEDQILHRNVFRERFVQPLQELNYLERKSGCKTPLKDLHLVNTSMIYNSTLNNNAAITMAKSAVNEILTP